jgi:hypothetical protein
MLMLQKRQMAISHQLIHCQNLHLLHVKIKNVRGASCVGVLGYGGINSNTQLMIYYGDQIFMSVAVGVMQMDVTLVNQDFHMNCLKQQLLILKQVH